MALIDSVHKPSFLIRIHILQIPTLSVKIWVLIVQKIIFADWLLNICSSSKFYEPSSKILWKHPLNITTLICWKSYLPSPVSPAQQPQHPMLLETDILCDKLQLGGLLSACTANAKGQLISKGLYIVFICTKKWTNIFFVFLS